MASRSGRTLGIIVSAAVVCVTALLLALWLWQTIDGQQGFLPQAAAGGIALTTLLLFADDLRKLALNSLGYVRNAQPAFGEIAHDLWKAGATLTAILVALFLCLFGTPKDATTPWMVLYSSKSTEDHHFRRAMFPVFFKRSASTKSFGWYYAG